jgi:hypothetical protein
MTAIITLITPVITAIITLNQMIILIYYAYYAHILPRIRAQT